VGSSVLLALARLVGGTGAILAAANAEPELCCAAFAGDAGFLAGGVLVRPKFG